MAKKKQTPLEVAQNELMKFYALGLTGHHIDKSFCADSLEKAVLGGVVSLVEKSGKKKDADGKVKVTVSIKPVKYPAKKAA